MADMNNPGYEGLQTDSIIDSIAGILASDEGVTNEPAAEEDRVENDPVRDDVSSEEEESEELEEKEEDSDDDGSDDSVEEEEFEEEDDDDLIEVKVNGVTSKVTKEQLIRSYQLDAAITQKSQAVSEKEKTLESQLAEVASLREKQVQMLESFKSEDQKRLDDFDKIDWNRLKEDDPETYILKREERRELIEGINQKTEQQKKLIEEQNNFNVDMFNKAKEAANEYLSSEQGIPGWDDEVKGPEIRNNIRQFAESVGFVPQELTLLIDPRALKVLDMARKYQEIQNEGKKIGDKKVPKANPKAPKKSLPRRKVTKEDGLRSKAEKAVKSGNLDDAAEFIMNMPGF